MEDLEHKVAVITGAASGIGLGIANALIAEGVNVAMVDVQQDALAAARSGLGDTNVDVQTYVCDVASRDAVRETAQTVRDHFGKVNILCNNAGVVAGGPADELTYDDWDWVMGVNLGGVINGMQEYIPLIKASGEGGHIVNTASILGHITGARQAIYSTTKYAVVGLSEAARSDLAPHNIGVSALCPGMINTNILRSDRNRPDDLSEIGSSFTADNKSMVETAFATQGLDPNKVGEQVVHGIRMDKAYIFTHAQLHQSITGRYEQIMAAFDGSEAEGGGMGALASDD